MPFIRSQTFFSPLLRVILFSLILLVAFGSAFCKFKKEAPPKPAMTKCLEDMKRIPEISAVMSNQNRADSAQARPLEGVEIALTINEMVKSVGNPDDEIDYWCDNENSLANLDKVIAALQRHHLPPTIAFIIGESADKVTMARWLDSGNLLGNMTFSRVNTKRHEPQDFFEDVLNNDKLLAPLLAQHHLKQKYFRYPKLKLSNARDVRAQLLDFLNKQGYTEVASMIETPDWQFSDLYCAARARGDETCVNLIRESFKTLLLDTMLKTRAAAHNKMGRDARLILSFSMNQFTCDFLSDWIDWLQNLGVRFISLDEALSDAIYRDVDEKGRPLYQAILRNAQRAQLSESQTE